jgi:two-component system sensor histidine kinase BaeS
MRLRLLLSFLLIVLVTVSGVVLLARSGAANEVRAFMFHGGMTGLDELAGLFEDYYRTNGSWQGVEEILNSSGHGRGMGQGGMGWGMGGMMKSQRLRLADVDGNIQLDTSLGITSQPPEGKLSGSEMKSAIPLRVNSDTVGYLLAESSMNFSVNDERFLVGRLTRAALLAGVVAAGFSSLLALLLAYSLMRPVRDLTRAASKLGEGDLSQRVTVGGNDELAVLGRAFNRMADALQSSQESRKAMTADIAHELRNPLAVQRANLEALQDGVYPLNPEYLEPILEQNLLLTHLVDDLRTLALADSGQLKLERVHTEIEALVGRIVEGFKPQASYRQIELILEIGEHYPPQFSMSVDPTRMDQIISNLLSNALRFTSDKGRIIVRLDIGDEMLEISVRDSGPGIPPEALPRVFDRFYRVDRSRSRSEGGSGLGLAIARHLAEAHGGALAATNHPQGGALFTLSLPLQR